MAHVYIHHKIKDYKAWKEVFDRFAGTRRSGGEISYEIFHPEGDPRNLMLLFEWASLEKAKTFLASPELKSAMQRAGVTEPPEIYHLTKVDEGKLAETVLT